jgi:hypothetical protein
MHVSLQLIVPPEHTTVHSPLEHTSGLVHASPPVQLALAPQYCMSVFGFTQRPLQTTSPVAQLNWHDPLLQNNPAPQACPQSPQWELSLRGLTQLPHHSCDPEQTETQLPAPSQARPEPQLCPLGSCAGAQ